MIGQTISRYKILEKIGEGGMGEVYLAQDTSLDRKIALKLPPKSAAQDELAAKRFLREAKSAASLDHPYICHIHEVGEAEGQHFIAMEYVEGETLKDRLLQGKLDLTEAIRLATEMAEALEVARSKGIVHRDLKPANIMLTLQGHAKIMDFGLAKRVAVGDGEEKEITSALTREGSTLGTLYYMSPEQVRAEALDPRSDIFSLGIIFYEMLTGVHPFRKPTAGETVSGILKDEPAPMSEHAEGTPEILQDIVDTMLVKDRESRCQSIREVQAGLNRLVSGGKGGFKRAISRRQQKRLAFVALGLLVTVTVAAFLIWTPPWKDPPESPPSEPVLLTSSLGIELCPSLSPDGNYLAYSWDGGTGANFDIYVRKIGCAEAHQITTDPDHDRFPAWSRDGRKLAFLRSLSDNEHTLCVASVFTKSETKIADLGITVGNDASYKLSWSSDEPLIAMVGQSAPEESRSIFLLALDTKEMRRFTSPPKGAWDEYPTFSPDGTAVAFIRNGPDQVHVCTQDLSRGPVNCLYSTPLYAKGLDWTSDGSALVVSLSEEMSRNSRLLRVPVGGDELQELPFGRGAEWVATARTSGRLVYEIWEQDLDLWRVSEAFDAREIQLGIKFIF